jgi:hypothetical protein
LQGFSKFNLLNLLKYKDFDFCRAWHAGCTVPFETCNTIFPAGSNNNDHIVIHAARIERALRGFLGRDLCRGRRRSGTLADFGAAGFGLGFSAVSPWADSGISAKGLAFPPLSGWRSPRSSHRGWAATSPADCG